MKKILIINKSFELGGIQIALINMLEAIQDKYDITLAIFNPNGSLKNKIPSGIKLLKLSPFVETLGMSSRYCRKNGTKIQIIFKVLGMIWTKIFNNSLPVSMALAFQKNVGEYDVVISYHQETSSKTLVTGFGKFALTKCVAPIKIAWVHADFVATKLATNRNLKIYEKFDKIVGVSQTCMNSFIKSYPQLKEKCEYCYNYIPEENIIKKSFEKSNVFQKEKNTIILFSACRLAKEKGIKLALVKLLPFIKRDNYELMWYIAGEGPEEKEIKRLIKVNNLEKNIILLGFQDNPYPYIREADYLFLPSLHETFSMVVGEAHVLGTPVIASNIPIMKEVLNTNDYLCKNNEFGECICEIITSRMLGNKNNLVKSNNNWLENFSRILIERK